MRYAHVVMTLEIALVAGAGACEKSGQAPAEMPTTVGAAPSPTGATLAARQQTPTVKRRMDEHFSKAAEMKAAIVRGDLNTANTAAAWLAGDEWTPHLRPDWRPYMQAMQSAARIARDAPDAKDAALALGRIGQACADCHTATARAKIVVLTPPLGASPARVLHARAAEKMWEGLVLPSNEAWIEGARALSTASMEIGAPTESKAAEPSKMFAPHLRDLARTAETAAVDRRGRLYGEIVVGCSICHRPPSAGMP